MENIDKKFEMTMFAVAFWVSLLSIIFPVVLFISLSWLWALGVWIISMLVITFFLSVISMFYEKPMHILIPLLALPVAIYFMHYVVISILGRGDKTEFHGYVKPYNLNWEIFNVFYFLKHKKLYQFATADISSFAHHKIIYHKLVTGKKYNTVVEIRDEADYALLLLETGGTQG